MSQEVKIYITASVDAHMTTEEMEDYIHNSIDPKVMDISRLKIKQKKEIYKNN
jgi:hypothetical protein